ncbi:hypothetical protein Tco_1079207 [Tanacetum coccineum]|uniref:Uncharacterized protein n=1 Tax=Tanacetum coccineum TaxID=301880 RepID=A0ABQ5HR84_9ASTR
MKWRGSTQGYSLASVEVLRFYTLAGNLVKEILLKLNLPDHRILKDGGEVKEFQRSFCYSDTKPLSRSDEVLKLKYFKKDATLKLFKSTNQERYEHVGPEVTSSQDDKVYKIAKQDYAWLMISSLQNSSISCKELFGFRFFITLPTLCRLAGDGALEESLTSLRFFTLVFLGGWRTPNTWDNKWIGFLLSIIDGNCRGSSDGSEEVGTHLLRGRIRSSVRVGGAIAGACSTGALTLTSAIGIANMENAPCDEVGLRKRDGFVWGYSRRGESDKGDEQGKLAGKLVLFNWVKAALPAQAVQELHELQRISAFFDDESVDTPLISPFPHLDNNSDDGEVLNELIEYENV